MQRDIVIIGGGLAGVETADMLIRAKIPVTLLDMKPFKKSPAHKNDNFAELVCSNSLRAKDPSASAVGILQREMTELDTLVMKSAIKNEVPAGGALAVNRELFSADITSALKNNPLFQFESREITELPQDKDKIYIIATGPLTSDKLAESIRERTGEDNLHFFDALAPIIDGESIDYSKAWFQSRYDKGNADDYLNCALTKEEYYDFVESLLNAEKTEFKDFEKDKTYKLTIKADPDGRATSLMQKVNHFDNAESFIKDSDFYIEVNCIIKKDISTDPDFERKYNAFRYDLAQDKTMSASHNFTFTTEDF